MRSMYFKEIMIIFWSLILIAEKVQDPNKQLIFFGHFSMINYLKVNFLTLRSSTIKVNLLRSSIGMVFLDPIPFETIAENLDSIAKLIIFMVPID